MAHLSNTATLAHDIRNLLSPALLIVERLESLSPNDDRAALNRLYKAIDRTVLLCQSRVNSERGEPHGVQGPCRLQPVIRDAVSSIIQNDGKRVRFSAFVPPDLHTSVPEFVVFRALINLFGNAIKAMDGLGGDIKVRAEAVEGRGVAIFVTDTASGMTLTTKCEVGAALSNPLEDGVLLGIGLRSTASALRRHGGSLHLVTSEESGTRFKIVLPGMDVSHGVSRS